MTPTGHSKHSLDLPIGLLVTDRAMEAWYYPSIARMTPNRRVTWQATSDDENSWRRSPARRRGRSRRAHSNRQCPCALPEATAGGVGRLAVPLKRTSTAISPDLKVIQESIEKVKELGFIKETVDASKYADLSLIEEATRRRRNGNWTPPELCDFQI